jgi:hypothetical protein
MDEHICRFNAGADDLSQQPHHGVLRRSEMVCSSG